MKKFFAAISAAAMLCGAVAGLTACGEDAHEHIWNDGEVTAEATCTADGVKTYHCTVEGCTESRTEKIDKIAHVFTGDWVKVDGENHAKKCANCEAVDTATAAHNFVEDTERRVDATCHSDGTKYLVCDACGAETTEAITERPAHDFDNGEWVKVDGDYHAKKCANCEAVDTVTAAHNFVEDTERRVDATCHSDGTKYLVCDVCGAETTEAITERPAHDYDNGEWVKVDVEHHAKKCANCEAVDSVTAAHNFVEDTERRVNATCHSDGTKYLVCDACGAETTEAITERPAHDYDNGEWVKVDGDNHAKKCANCEAVDETVIAHTWNEGEVTTKPTLWQAGEKSFACDDCGATKTEPVEAKTSVTYKEDFNLNIVDGKQTGDWKYGTVNYQFDTAEDYTFTEFTANNGSDAWMDAAEGPKVEIKDEFVNANGMWAAVTFTFKEETTATVNFTFTGTIPKDADGNRLTDDNGIEIPQSRFNCRIGIKDVDGVIYGNPEFRGGEVCEYFVTKQFKAGDTICFMIEHAGTGWTSGSLNIGIVKGA